MEQHKAGRPEWTRDRGKTLDLSYSGQSWLSRAGVGFSRLD